MGEVKHIVFSDASKGVLGFYLRTNDTSFDGKILGIREDYSMGPIHNIGTKEGMKKRIDWLNNMLDKVALKEYFDTIDQDLYAVYSEIVNIKEDAKVIIWHAKNTSDQIGLRFVMKHLKSKDIHEVNVSENRIEGENGNTFMPASLGQCHPKCIEILSTQMKQVSDDRREKLSSEWDKLKDSTDLLHVLIDDKIIGVKETYFDHELLNNCTKAYKNAAQIVGETMGTLGHYIGDTYLDYRLRVMIDDEVVAYQGNLEMLREFEIRAN